MGWGFRDPQVGYHEGLLDQKKQVLGQFEQEKQETIIEI